MVEAMNTALQPSYELNNLSPFIGGDNSTRAATQSQELFTTEVDARLARSSRNMHALGNIAVTSREVGPKKMLLGDEGGD